MSRRKTHHGLRLRPAFLAWFISGALILALALTFGSQANAQAQQANDETAIKNVVLTAFSGPAKAVVVPHTPTDFSAVGLTKTTLSAAQVDVAVAQTQARTLFSSVYATTCVPCQTMASRTYQTIQNETSGNYRALGWGVADVEWRQVLVNGQTASVTLAATLSSKVQYIDEFGKLNTVTPTEGLVKIYSLTKIGTNWLITNQVQDDIATNSLPVNNPKLNGQTGGPPVDQPPPVKTDTKVTK